MENERMMTNQGIGLFKIDYEMDLVGNKSREDNAYQAGIIAYGSEEAQNTLLAFLNKRVEGFKGMKVNQMAFEGYCHAVSDNVRKQILKGAVADGLVVYPAKVEEAATDEVVKEEKQPKKKSIVKG